MLPPQKTHSALCNEVCPIGLSRSEISHFLGKLKVFSLIIIYFQYKNC